MKDVVIIGASGHGKVVADIVLKSGDNILGFLDDNNSLPDQFIGFPVLGKIESYVNYKENADFVIAIGNPLIRERIVNKLKNVNWYTAIHPSSIISSIGTKKDNEIYIGEGTVIMANAVINSGSRIGNHCIINTSSVVEHDNIIEDFAHVSVGAKLGGTVHVGRRAWIGIGSTIKNNITISDDCIIGAGAVVVKDIDSYGTYVGIPAERIDMNKLIGGGYKLLQVTNCVLCMPSVRRCA